MRVVVKKHGKNHSYLDEDAGGEKIAGVTGLVGDGLPKPALMNWHAEATAGYAIDNWEELSKMPASARLKKLMGGRYESRDAAANKGKQIHTLAERLIAGDKVTVPDELVDYVEGCVRFLNDFDLRAVHVEAVVYSEKYRHAGRLDLIADVLLPDMPEYDHIGRSEDGYSRGLFDWKSGRTGIFGDVSLQLAPYRFSEYMILPDGEVIDMPEVDFVAGIWLRPGAYEVRPLVCEREQYRDFLYVKEVARIQTSLRDLVGEAIVPPTASRFELVKAGDEFAARPAALNGEAIAARRKAIEDNAKCEGCGSTLVDCKAQRGKDPTAPSWFGCCARGTDLSTPCRHVVDAGALAALLREVESGAVR